MYSKIRFSILSLLALFVLIGCSPNRYSQVKIVDQDVLEEADEDENESADLAKVGANKSSKYGWYLVDAGGRTLYMFKADSRYESSDCYGQCADVWPPLLTSANPEAVAQIVNSEMLGTIERRDGSMQVTYNGWPLYYYVEDQGEGKFTGQDVKGFGAEWYLMAPAGSYIHKEGGNGYKKMHQKSDYMNNQDSDMNNQESQYMNNQDADYMNNNMGVAKVSMEKSEMHGAYLTDQRGRTLYIYIDDTRYEASNCYGDCEDMLTPLITTAEPVAVVNAVNTAMLGTIERRDGTMQVTYNGWPLYYYEEDNQPGEMNGLYDTDEVDKLYLVSPIGDAMPYDSITNDAKNSSDYNASNDYEEDYSSNGIDYKGAKESPITLAKVGAADSDKYGRYLVDANGRTLYVFLDDSRYESSDCYKNCEDVWPPLLTSDAPVAITAAVNAEMLGTIERENGKMQVTYNGWPLYYFVLDLEEGKFTGQDYKDFGAEWYMMAPDGSYIDQESHQGQEGY